MEEERTTRRASLLIALAGVILLVAVSETMALAGGSTPAGKPAAKAPVAKAKWSAGLRPLLFYEAARRATSSRTIGATFVPKSSIARIVLSCGSEPTVNWIRKRSCRKSSCW